MLQIEHVSKTFNPGTINEKKALIDLNVSLKDGDFATIVREQRCRKVYDV